MVIIECFFVEWSAKNGVQRRDNVLLQRTHRIPRAQSQLEGLRHKMELTIEWTARASAKSATVYAQTTASAVRRVSHLKFSPRISANLE